MGNKHDIDETVLIREGVYCGHRFSSGNLSAVWFFEEDQVKVYGANRQLLYVESLDDDMQPTRRAA